MLDKPPNLDDFVHVEQEGDQKLHISHLHHYVSAYELCDATVATLRESLVEGLKKARETSERVIVDQDGEMFFVCNPSGTFTLCVPWKTYKPLPLDDFERELKKVQSV